MVSYILQTIAFQLSFLVAYELFLKKETFFSYNRAYLLLTPVVSLLLPVLKVPGLENVVTVENLVVLPEVFIGGKSKIMASGNVAPVTSEGFQTINWWLLIYIGGALFSVGIFINKFKVLRELFSYQPVVKNERMKVVEVPESTIACTFYDTIFLGAQLSEKERKQILSHEMVHVKQKHTLDLLFFEVLRIIFWFNPLIYIYQSRVSTLHEYLADAGVVKNVKKQDYFQQLLNSAFNTEGVSFINQFFNQSIIKNRIVMLQKAKSTSSSKLKFLIVLPLMLAMLTYVSCSEDPVVSPEEQETTAQEKLKEIKAIINDGTEITAEDTERIQGILSTISTKELEESELDPEKDQVQKMKATSKASDIPFAVIEEVPLYPGCESLETNDDRKTCMSEKITEFVGANFDTSLGKANGLTGKNRVYVQFRINKDGSAEVLGVRAAHPALQEEAERVINLLPNMTPGRQKGEEVGVLYMLPITFQVGE